VGSWIDVIFTFNEESDASENSILKYGIYLFPVDEWGYSVVDFP